MKQVSEDNYRFLSYEPAIALAYSLDDIESINNARCWNLRGVVIANIFWTVGKTRLGYNFIFGINWVWFTGNKEEFGYLLYCMFLSCNKIIILHATTLRHTIIGRATPNWIIGRATPNWTISESTEELKGLRYTVYSKYIHSKGLKTVSSLFTCHRVLITLTSVCNTALPLYWYWIL